MASITICSPKSMGVPLGLYKQMTKVSASEFVFIAGQLSSDKKGEVVGKNDFAAQFTQVFDNIRTALTAENMNFSNIVRFTTYLVDPRDIESFMEMRAKYFPDWFENEAYPPNTLLVVNRLVKEEFLIEVDVVAAR